MRGRRCGKFCTFLALVTADFRDLHTDFTVSPGSRRATMFCRYVRCERKPNTTHEKIVHVLLWKNHEYFQLPGIIFTHSSLSYLYHPVFLFMTTRKCSDLFMYLVSEKVHNSIIFTLSWYSISFRAVYTDLTFESCSRTNGIGMHTSPFDEGRLFFARQRLTSVTGATAPSPCRNFVQPQQKGTRVVGQSSRRENVQSYLVQDVWTTGSGLLFCNWWHHPKVDSIYTNRNENTNIYTHFQFSLRSAPERLTSPLLFILYLDGFHQPKASFRITTES